MEGKKLLFKGGKRQYMNGFYMIPDYFNLKDSAELAKENGLGFEYNDFCFPGMLDNSDMQQERINEYFSLDRDRSNDTMHGAFFDVTVFSCDPKIREVSLLRMRQSMEIAKKMGLRAVIFHGNYLPFLRGEGYDKLWIAYTEETIRNLEREYSGIGIYLENMFDDSPEMLVRLAERLTDVPEFGLCLDYSHALLTSGKSEVWMRTMAPYIRHMHVNDHCFEGDTHLVPGEGKTDWKEFAELKEKYAPKATVLFEVSGIEKAKRALQFFTDSGKITM